MFSSYLIARSEARGGPRENVTRNGTIMQTERRDKDVFEQRTDLIMQTQPVA